MKVRGQNGKTVRTDNEKNGTCLIKNHVSYMFSEIRRSWVVSHLGSLERPPVVSSSQRQCTSRCHARLSFSPHHVLRPVRTSSTSSFFAHICTSCDPCSRDEDELCMMLLG